ncbi:hypothetical protein O6H91_06G035100 [Diphasiastrum complanatum]|uniref:Uncharacterized protein n=1 Tax=Diphasiastrum complanatum TaxID=34168 RepID=A0ACC2DCK3_DIPCM|nr:hypothetical protein O6H91_Y083300 [Diphasiastrum complanatum]KAJ7551935.1 hypothetical protein O6H91_06G035100 [Diphasiastrum complanatum]
MERYEKVPVSSTILSSKSDFEPYLTMDTMALQQLENLEKELEQAKQKILVLRAQEHHQKSSLENKRVSESRYWTNEERQRFKKALKTFGTDFSAIAKFVGTRSSTQVRTHAQKYYAKLIRDYKRSGKTQAAGKGREEKEVSNKRLVSL